MNKLIWIAIVIVVLVIGGFMLFGKDKQTDGPTNPDGGLVVDGNANTDGSSTGTATNSLDSEDDVFNEIDSALNYVE